MMMMSHDDKLNKQATNNEEVVCSSSRTTTTEIEEPLLPSTAKDDRGATNEERLERGCMRSFDASISSTIGFGLPLLVFVLVNSALYAILFSYYDVDGKEERVSIYHYKSQVAALVLIADTIFFWKAIGWLKIEQTKLEEEEEDEKLLEERNLKEEEDSSSFSSKDGGGCACAGLDDDERQGEPIAKPTSTSKPHGGWIPKYPFARFSRILDAFLLGGNNSPSTVPNKKVSTLMGLFYAIMVLCAAGSMSAVGVRMTSKEMFDCLSYRQRPNKKFSDSVDSMDWEKRFEKAREDAANRQNIEGIPDGLQDWAKPLTNWWLERRTLPGSYVHMKDGRTFFTGMTWTDEPESNNAAANKRSSKKRHPDYYRQNILFETSPNGSLKKFEKILDPKSFVVVQGGSPEDDTVGTFCCTYNNEVPVPYDDSLEEPDYSSPKNSLLCVSSNDVEYRNTSLPGEDNPNLSRRFETLKSFEGTLWYATLWYAVGNQEDIILREHNRHRNHGDAWVTFYQLDPTSTRSGSSMQWQLMATVTVEKSSYRSHMMMGDDEEFLERMKKNKACIVKVIVICSLLAGLVVFPAAFWLLRVKRVAAGISPACCVVIYYMVHALGKEYFYFFTFWLSLLSTILIIRRSPKGMEREALIWAHYSLCSYLAVLEFFVDHEEMQLINLFWIIFLGTIMNHRTLEIAGYCVGCLFIFMAFCGSGDESVPNMLFLPMAIIVPCGMITIDRQIQKYHSYIAFRLKRLTLNDLRESSSS